MSYSNYDLNSKVNYLNSVITTTIPVIESKISSLQVPPTPNELVVVDRIVVADTYPLFSDTTTITSTAITITDTGSVSLATLANNQLYIATSSGAYDVGLNPLALTFTNTVTSASAIYDTNGVIIDSGSSVAQITPLNLTMTDTFTNNYSSLGYDGFLINDTVSGESTTIDKNSITMTPQSGGFNQLIISNDPSVSEPFIRLDDSLGLTNVLDADRWTGNINSVNTVANLVHYLGFFDNSGTGYGKPQKSALLSCNPSSGLMSALFFSGDEILPLTQNTATFAGTTLSFSGASGSTAVSYRNAGIVITGASNTISTLTITNTLVNGEYKIGILNNGSGNLTFNTGLGANIKTIYSVAFNVPTGRYAQLTIDVLVINSTTTYIVNAVLLTN